MTPNVACRSFERKQSTVLSTVIASLRRPHTLSFQQSYHFLKLYQLGSLSPASLFSPTLQTNVSISLFHFCAISVMVPIDSFGDILPGNILLDIGFFLPFLKICIFSWNYYHNQDSENIHFLKCFRELFYL